MLHHVVNLLEDGPHVFASRGIERVKFLDHLGVLGGIAIHELANEVAVRRRRIVGQNGSGIPRLVERIACSQQLLVVCRNADALLFEEVLVHKDAGSAGEYGGHGARPRIVFAQQARAHARQVDVERRIGEVLGVLEQRLVAVGIQHEVVREEDVGRIIGAQGRRNEVVVIVDLGVAQLDVGVILVELVEFGFERLEVIVAASHGKGAFRGGVERGGEALLLARLPRWRPQTRKNPTMRRRPPTRPRRAQSIKRPGNAPQTFS